MQQQNDIANDDLQTLERRELFGGALEVHLPSRFIDISSIRDVPDNQEIFADSKSTDQSFIIELLSMSEDVRDENIGEYLFHDLCDVNGVTSSEAKVIQVVNCSDSNTTDSFKQILIGQQQVAKHREEVKNVVNFYMGVIRLKNVTTDLLITFNDPVQIHPDSSSASNSIALGYLSDHSRRVFQAVFDTLKVNDWSIFG
jgi:hypothetical protein